MIATTAPIAQRIALARKELSGIVAVIERVDQRCMAADGPVTPTRQEITDKEMRSIYLAARRAFRHLTPRD